MGQGASGLTSHLESIGGPLQFGLDDDHVLAQGGRGKNAGRVGQEPTRLRRSWAKVDNTGPVSNLCRKRQPARFFGEGEWQYRKVNLECLHKGVWGQLLELTLFSHLQPASSSTRVKPNKPMTTRKPTRTAYYYDKHPRLSPHEIRAGALSVASNPGSVFVGSADTAGGRRTGLGTA